VTRLVRWAAIAAIDLSCAWGVLWMFDWRGVCALLAGLWSTRALELIALGRRES